MPSLMVTFVISDGWQVRGVLLGRIIDGLAALSAARPCVKSGVFLARAGSAFARQGLTVVLAVITR